MTLKTTMMSTPVTSFDPATVSGIVAWFKADSLVLADGDPVSSWSDSSGNSHTATSTSTARPTYRSAPTGFNGKPALQFDGSNDTIGTAGFALTSLDLTVFAVIRATDYANFNGIISKTDASGNPKGMDFYLITSTGIPRFLRRSGFGANYNVDGTSAPGTSTTRVVEVVQASTTISHYRDGAANGSGSGGTITIDDDATKGLIVGNRTDGFTKFKGYIAEVLLYSAAVSSGDRLSIRQYLGTKYGVTVV